MKIFEIGYGRTGTGSITAAVRALGYRVLHWGARYHREMISELLAGRLYSCIDKYDYVSDFVAPLFRELDDAYPGSKFILSIRDEAKWWQSLCEHVQRKNLQPRMNFITFYRMQKFGCFDVPQNPQRVLRAYREHAKYVQEYFRDRPDDLLVLNVSAGDGWNKLCPFLGKPVPNRPFPHRHRKPAASDRNTTITVTS